MKFKYSLEAVLNFKKELENLARIRLEESISIFQKRSEEVQRQKQKRALWMAKWPERNLSVLEAGEYFLGKIYNEFWRDKIKVLEQEKLSWAKKVELEKDKLKAIRQEREILEKLREKKWRYFCQEINKLEQKINDEIVLFKYNPLLKEEENISLAD